MADRMGPRRQGRRAEPDHARDSARGGRAGEAGQDRDARQALCVRHPVLRRARLPAQHPGHAHRRAVRQQRAGVPRRAGHRRDRPGRHPVRRPGPHRRPHLGGRPLLQRPRARGDLRARPRQHGPGHGRPRRRVSSPRRASSAAACCSMRPSTAASTRCRSRPSTDSPGIVTADDVKAMVQAAGIDEIGEGDCVFLYTGHGDLWKNSEWPSLSAEEKAERRPRSSSPASRASAAAPASTSPSRRSS